MITKKELQYVDLWSTKIPMPGVEYSKYVMDELKLCYNIYLNKYKNKDYNLTFSNGEEIDFHIIDANLCHMLGIDYKNIKGDYFPDTVTAQAFIKYRNDVLGLSQTFTSFELLEAILENSDKIVENDNDNRCKIKILNYYKTLIKCNIFRKISDFEKFNFLAINYRDNDKKYDYANSKKLVIPSNEAVCPYFMMGINKTVDEKYIVHTLMAPENPKIYFENQEVIMPTQILMTNNNELKKIEAKAEEKIQLLTTYKNIINSYNIPYSLNTRSDYETMLNDMARQEEYRQYQK